MTHYSTEELRQMCAEAGMEGLDAQTAIIAYRRHLLAGNTKFSADSIRVACIVANREYNEAHAEPPADLDPLARKLIQAFGGYDDLEWARLEPVERDWLIEKGNRAAKVARRYLQTQGVACGERCDWCGARATFDAPAGRWVHTDPGVSLAVDHAARVAASACGCPVNEIGDVRCHICGEFVNVRCWNCKTPRGEGSCPIPPRPVVNDDSAPRGAKVARNYFGDDREERRK